MPAIRSDWKTVGLPTQRKQIPFDRTYTAAEFARIKEGLIPECMEDKWFVFYEEPWLYFHRSWTGYCVYQLRLEPCATEIRVAELWVSRDPEQYQETDDTWDALLLTVLLDGRAGRKDQVILDQWTALLRSRHGNPKVSPGAQIK